MLLFSTSILVHGQINVLEAASESDYLNIEVALQQGYNAFEVQASEVSLAEFAISEGDQSLLTTILDNTHTLSNQNAFFLFSTAIDYQQSDIIEYLLSTNIHNNINQMEMYNLVTLAIQHDDAQIYQLLTDYFPSVDTQYKDFLFSATISDRFNVFSHIFKNKNIPATEKNTEESLIHRAANSLSIATFLIHKGADINALTTNGETPLHLTKNIKIARLLIKNGADVDVKDKKGYTALDYARKAEDTAMVHLFESALNIR